MEIAVLVVEILVQLVVLVGKLVVYRVVLAIELLVQTSVFSPRHLGVLGVRRIVFGLEVLVALLVFRVEPPVPRSVLAAQVSMKKAVIIVTSRGRTP